EIVRFHTVIWGCMLMALGLDMPKKVYGHGWLIVDGAKMSKSVGNVVDPIALIEEFGADAVRYFLLREITLGQDGNISRDALIGRINSDLANDLGNLLHRTLSMAKKYRQGVIRKSAGRTDFDAALEEMAAATVRDYTEQMEQMELSAAIKTAWALISRTNKYIDETAPWTLAKDEARAAELDSVLYHLVESLRMTSILIAPFLPATARRIHEQLGCTSDFAAVQLADTAWGGTEDGHTVGTAEQLFPRIEIEK
ncbi:MAG: class I tRNA ligase family protein, partial [Selenomonas massiliensis]